MSTAVRSPIEDFIQTDSNAMVAAALHILGGFADDAEARREVVAPWAWNLRQRARELSTQGMTDAADRAKAIARMVSAVALGEIGTEELLAAAACVDVPTHELDTAIDVLTAAMKHAR